MKVKVKKYKKTGDIMKAWWIEREKKNCEWNRP